MLAVVVTGLGVVILQNQGSKRKPPPQSRYQICRAWDSSARTTCPAEEPQG
jgi:hypothetical protein